MMKLPSFNNPLFRRQAAGCLLALLVYCAALLLPTPEGLGLAGKKALALMISAIIIWVSDALPLAMSCTLFLFLQGVLGTAPMDDALRNFAIPPVFFCFAMFCIVVAFQNSGLTRRIVLWTSMKSKGRPGRLLFLLMMMSGALSTILADVPVVAMMFPVALFLLEQNGCVPGKGSFGKAVMLGLPLACLIGGVGTPAGSGTNILTMNMLSSTAGVQISFFQWSAIGLPMALLLIPVAWWAVMKIYPPELTELAGMDELCADYECLGPLGRQEKLYIVLLAVNLTLWCTTGLHGLSLPAAAVLGSMLFALPGVSLISWEQDRHKIGWDILFLVGSANSLGVSLWQSGAATWIADTFLSGMSSLPLVAVIALVSLFTILIHLVIPVNTPIVGVILPPVAAIASAMGINPALLALPLGFSVSAAVLLPLDSVSLVTYQAGY
ncbi:SLC13 family permease [Mailhella massiliensis]|uniref:Anion permease n=1 Tax=Mailhella massiliensis TaxID=1903261 RepID=A0A921AXE7_9BACT|nr:SLC13 family permease [Mailhella massiliensis]HJD97612.1 anion permease [Mailhella massiliensis]